ncbi:MAG TPA: DUF1800 domain-containing protein [Puia sp.]|jgi:uncharacterized protein (DUF1800 family)
MRIANTCLGVALLTGAGFFVLSSFGGGGVLGGKEGRMPWRQAGLTERQAAAHLISRFTYGATPGQVDAVVKEGLENWFRQQLEAREPNDSLDQLLSGYDALKLSNEEIARTYPKGGELIRMAIRDGIVDKDSVKTDRKEYRATLQKYMQEKGLKPEQELIRQFICQKVLRAAYSRNQLREVMADFWFNHFNVSLTKNDCAEFIPDYERDVIRPGALGHFGDLLLATAKSPAMLYYLDNFSSSATNNKFRPGPPPPPAEGMMMDGGKAAPVLPKRPPQGLNENYAREVMELHTLGVDGGYTQTDVTQAARVLTGWTVYPMGQYGRAGQNQLARLGEDRMSRLGFVHEGDFLFNANRHDVGEKTVLGKHFGPDGGYHEGVDLLNMLAHHPSTAHFIARKIAVRFVSDDPSPALVERMAKTFLDKDGDIKEVLITMVTSPEFWNAAALREKTKSPFELAIGAVRGLHATIDRPYLLYTWVARMGEKKYYYQAPTGFPDKGAYWINTGSLLNRMNFGLALASGRIPGVSFDLAALNDHHEPESARAALAIYGKLLLPERDLGKTIQRLEPMLNDPELGKKVETASAKVGAVNPDMAGTDRGEMKTNGEDVMNGDGQPSRDKDKVYARARIEPVMADEHAASPMLAQVVGIIIGSPEYQRR